MEAINRRLPLEASRISINGIVDALQTPERRTGATSFIQIFEKRRDEAGVPRVSCISYPLEVPVGTEDARLMIATILGYDENSPKSAGSMYESSDGELLFGARSGGDRREIHKRFITAPTQLLGVDQTERKKELIGGVYREFNDSLSGMRHASAQASEGRGTFAFSYRVDEENGKLYGKDRQGKEGKPLSELGMDGYPEHEKMLTALEQTLIDMDEGFVINFDKSPTVKKCCDVFFADKQGPQDIFARTVHASSTSSFYFGPAIVVENDKKSCKHGKQPKECLFCKSSEVAAGE